MAQELFPLQNHPKATSWPTDGWPEGTLSADRAAKITALADIVMASELHDLMGETRAIVIIHQGELVFEAYREGFGPETKQISWSMAKSLTQSLVGRALMEGVIENIDTPMPTPFAIDDPRASITWRQWLNMADGLDYHEIGTNDLEANDVVQMMFGKGRFDVMEYIINDVPAKHKPGTHWNYSTAGFHLIGRALQQETGSVASADGTSGKARTTAWMEEILFAPLGMDAQPEFDPTGTYLGGSLIWASARDFAKFGYLYLRDGMWEETRLLPEGWVDFARTNTTGTNTNVYGAGWWKTAYGETRTQTQTATTPPWDAFHAGGHEGQTIWVVPSRDLVIVHLGLMPNTEINWDTLYEWNQEVVRVFPEVY